MGLRARGPGRREEGTRRMCSCGVPRVVGPRGGHSDCMSVGVGLLGQTLLVHVCPAILPAIAILHFLYRGKVSRSSTSTRLISKAIIHGFFTCSIDRSGPS